jgi:hypothetical protein
MKTFIAAQLGLAPLAAFWLLLGLASPGAALAVGLAASLAMTARPTASAAPGEAKPSSSQKAASGARST